MQYARHLSVSHASAESRALAVEANACAAPKASDTATAPGNIHRRILEVFIRPSLARVHPVVRSLTRTDWNPRTALEPMPCTGEKHTSDREDKREDRIFVAILRRYTIPCDGR
jgi:hypothetical protein